MIYRLEHPLQRPHHQNKLHQMTQRPPCCILLLCGLPAAGKTSLLEKLREHSPPKIAVQCISYDDLIDSSQGEDWKLYRRKGHDSVIEAVNTIKRDEEKVLIVDDNLYYRSMRHTLYLLALNKTAVQRNRERISNRVPDEVIERMHSKLEPPDGTKYPWESNSFTLSTHSGSYSLAQRQPIDIGDIWLRVFDFWSQPLTSKTREERQEEEKMREKERERTLKDEAHQLDIMTRRIISETLKDVKSDKKEAAHTLKKLREDYMREKKEGKSAADFLNFCRSVIEK
ncbi:hypothetical protein PROFUN_11935 [Planoprotostelium fungivorum]|uniref:L-seryl-tRNA(Sec) kinase n=1 Tax=Planoprotostelium fungivorum TaxID=1890364 RepID=A0A2P6N8S8_9EUKA|nr:hypothetical protein PROFUN_11935 [Planoprotostelium fungivorum]